VQSYDKIKPEPAEFEAKNHTVSEEYKGGQVEEAVRQRVTGATPYKVEQFANLFIVAFSKDQMTIVDQHAAHERILYEKALESFDKNKMDSQKLLIPVNVEMEPSIIAASEEYFDMLYNLGFELERFGPRAIIVNAVPAVSSQKNPETLVKDLLADLIEYGAESADRFKMTAQRFACRVAIKAGDRLSEEMMKALIKALFETENPYICPHGRPTILRFSSEELRERFGR